MTSSAVFRLDLAIADDSNAYVIPQVTHVVGGEEARDGLVLHLDPATRFTDFITQSLVPGPALIVSERVAAVLAGFSVDAHRAYDVRVLSSRGPRPYRWLAFASRFSEAIDWSRTTLEIVRDHGREPVTFADASAVAACARALISAGVPPGAADTIASGPPSPTTPVDINTLEGDLRVTHLALSAPLDLVVATVGLHEVFVSDRLASALRALAPTGVVLRPVAP